MSGRTARAARRTDPAETARAARRAAASRPADVWGRDDLTCPLTAGAVAQLLHHAHAHPWRGDRTLTCPGHRADTTAITEPGRPVRLLLSLDHGYHQSGWFANSDYERCLHLSVSFPRPDRPKLWLPRPGVDGLDVPVAGQDLEAPADAEVRAWGRVFFHEHALMSWLEPAVGPLDPYRTPGVSHLRLYLDQAGRPFTPTGEVYTLRPFEDGTSPAKVTDGRLGADIR
jgi:hypothetical protein